MMSFLSEQLRKHINSCEQIIRDITDFTITLIDDISQDNEELKQKLESEGITCEYGNLSQDALVILKGNVIKTKAFEQGWFYVQDESSMLVARALKPKHHSKVLDTCSAPGGKTTHVAELMRQTGTVYANDVYEHKIKLIEDNVKRLGLTNVVATLQDEQH